MLGERAKSPEQDTSLFCFNCGVEAVTPYPIELLSKEGKTRRIISIRKVGGPLPTRKGEGGKQSPYRSQSESRAVFDPRSYAIVGLDTQGRIIFSNKAVEELFQYSRTELLGQSVEILMPVRFRRKNVEQSRRYSPSYWNHFMNANAEFHARQKNGTEFPAEVISEILEIEEGTIILATIRNLHDRKHMDDQSRQAQKMEALGRLAGGVAHDFNNLLSIMLGYTEMALKRPDLKGPFRKSLEEIQKAGATAASLSHQLLLFSRKEIQNPEVVNLNHVVSEMGNILQQLLGEDVEVVVRKDPSLGAVKVDPTQIKQVILNLAANARDAMPRGGKLVIETGNVEICDTEVTSSPDLPPGRYVRLKVVDTGRGISEHIRSHLFEPFFTTKKEGTGLGLATTYGIVKNSGGIILVDSTPMEGTAFSIYLPHLITLNEMHPAPNPEDDMKPVSGSKTVLVVEDKEALRKLVCKYLNGCGYNVLEAKDGLRALRKARRHPGPIHLLLSDVVMPTLSGPELAMRLIEQRPEMKVLFMSGYAEDMIRNQGILHRKFTVLRKPFSLAVLARNVSEVLGG